MDLQAFLSSIAQEDERPVRPFALWTVSSREAAYAELPDWLHPDLTEALVAQGIRRLYAHQAEALDLARAERDFVVATGTASGKSLCYNLPVLNAILQRRTTRALYIFPTKALAQDQWRKLMEFGAASALCVATYDGDTPVRDRANIRRHAHVLLTNPDMLHLAILPNHRLWADFFRRLEYVVVDELHVYRGVFGSHAAHVFRRLRRICEHYGSRPQLTACSATITNPAQLGESLFGLPLAVVDTDCSPAGEKTYIVWGAPSAQDDPSDEGPLSGSPYGEAAWLMARLIESGIRTIAFAQSRRSAEALLLRSRGILARRAPRLAGRLLAYRGGYLPEERRDIERKLFRGDLLGVCATSALELGVDVGGLEACIMVGYPGTVASFQQQAGRVGRAGAPSAVFLIPMDITLDQYIARHPEFLRDRLVERATADPTNRFILGGHLVCAAKELPISESELSTLWGEAPDAPAVLELLADAGYVVKRTRWYAAPGLEPASEVGLRSSTGRAYEVVTSNDQRLVGTVDAATAQYYLHPGAVYLHQGAKYLVHQLDQQRRRATVEPADVPYLTLPNFLFEPRVDAEIEHRAIGRAVVRYAELTMTSTLVSYTETPDFGRGEPRIVPMSLPPESFETVGILITFEPTLSTRLRERGHGPLGSLHALEHAAIAVLPLICACDRHDVAGYSTLADTLEAPAPVICLSDNHPGGVGIADEAYSRLEELLRLAHGAIADCPCDTGCPGCIQAASCGSNNQPLDKQGALEVIATCLGAPN